MFRHEQFVQGSRGHLVSGADTGHAEWLGPPHQAPGGLRQVPRARLRQLEQQSGLRTHSGAGGRGGGGVAGWGWAREGASGRLVLVYPCVVELVPFLFGLCPGEPKKCAILRMHQKDVGAARSCHNAPLFLFQQAGFRAHTEFS